MVTSSQASLSFCRKIRFSPSLPTTIPNGTLLAQQKWFEPWAHFTITSRENRTRIQTSVSTSKSSRPRNVPALLERPDREVSISQVIQTFEDELEAVGIRSVRGQPVIW